MKTVKVIVLAVVVSIFSVNVYARDISVAAAANLQPVLGQLTTAFEKQNDIHVKIIIGSSGQLTAQIENGAPFDVFLSADMKYPKVLYKKGLALQEPKAYAYGVLVLWTLKDVDLSKGMAILSDEQIKKIALADPQLAPYGREAVRAMKFYKLYQDIQKRLVYGESISQTNGFIASRSADIGFTSKSTVLSPNLKDKGTWTEVAPESYGRIAQGVVCLKHSQKDKFESVQKFYNFLFSTEAKMIFKKYGYRVDE